MSRIYDNIETKFLDGLVKLMEESNVKRADFCVGYFNLRGWKLIVNQIDNLEGDFVYEDATNSQQHRCCRLLIGMHRPDEQLVRDFIRNSDTMDAASATKYKLKVAQDFRKQLLIGVPTCEDRAMLLRLCSQLREGKVCVKLYLREPLHAKLYIIHRQTYRDPIMSVMGSSNLTFSGLTKQGELNAEIDNGNDNEKLDRWFNDRWNDRFCLDITAELIAAIEQSWAREEPFKPYYVYLKTAYHLCEDARSGINEYTLPPEFRHKLFDFQQIAVQIAAKHLNNEKINGAMIGDVVGLGKTITACAIAKIFENSLAGATLILCPASLVSMWQKYVIEYDIKADVKSISQNFDVDNMRRYKLIIIDESHNLRNSEGRRYKTVKKIIDSQECRVLLLSATPFNKNYQDLGNQLRLFIDNDKDLGIRPEKYIEHLGGERQFSRQHNDISMRSIAAFEKSEFVEDWNDLMKLFLVRRTRTFIRKNYAKTDPKNNRQYLEYPDHSRSYFPDRVPLAKKFATTPGDQYSTLYSDQMVAKIESLNLPRYGLNLYVSESKTKNATPSDQILLENLSKAGKRMMGFCKSTMFKRVDSSGYSFLLTIYRHILRNSVFIYAIENGLDLPIGDENTLPDDFSDDQDQNQSVEENAAEVSAMKFPSKIEFYRAKAEHYYNSIASQNNVKWLSSSYFKTTLKKALEADCKILLSMIELCGAWQPANDPKLNMLQDMLISEHINDKVLIFTQYSDTAYYISSQLQQRGIQNVDVVTGQTDDQLERVKRFSPKSNGAAVTSREQTRILIATDVLSEGQNLQDCHVIINYDLPWAIIRLIQRAGRVDRIGQEAEKIYCYSFFPADGVEQIINLRHRLNDRINQNAGIVGSDEIFFEGNEQNLRDLYNEKSGALDGEDDETDVDYASLAYQIWKNAIDARPELKTEIPRLPDVCYATKQSLLGGGVITYAKTYNDFDVITWIAPDGSVVTQNQKRILEAMACNYDEPALEPIENHFDLVATAVEQVSRNSITNTAILGNRFSTRFKVYDLMTSVYENMPVDIYFTQEKKDTLKFAIDQIYQNQLKDAAKHTLGSMIRGRRRTMEIIDEILELFAAGQFCRVRDDEYASHDPRIICSMGLATEQLKIEN
ncbi:MAG: helicase [Bacteroidales bacterium]|nr:helicase [Bacteroidales bacterium]